MTPNPAPGWTAWPMVASLRSALANPQKPYGVAWTSSDETSAAWAYFAKREYDNTLAPAASYLYKRPVPIQISFTPNTLDGGALVTASLIVNGMGLGDSAVVALSQTHVPGTTVTNFPASVTVTGLARTFIVGTNQGVDPTGVQATSPGNKGSVLYVQDAGYGVSRSPSYHRQFAYQYNDFGKKTSETNLNGVVTQYSYGDPWGNLTQVSNRFKN